MIAFLTVEANDQGCDQMLMTQRQLIIKTSCLCLLVFRSLLKIVCLLKYMYGLWFFETQYTCVCLLVLPFPFLSLIVHTTVSALNHFPAFHGSTHCYCVTYVYFAKLVCIERTLL